MACLQLYSFGAFENGDLSGCSVDFDEGSICDAFSCVLNGNNAWQSEFSADDHCVAYLAADIDNDCVNGEEQWGPCRVGERCDHDISWLQVWWGGRISDNASPSCYDSGATCSAGEYITFGNGDFYFAFISFPFC